MFAIVQFAAPALLAGVTVAVVPAVIHLLLRPRPRPVRFPAVTFLHSTLASGQRAQRLRNIWLLLIRMLMLAGAALWLAGPTCAPNAANSDVQGPVACVLVVDDSWSMRYRLEANQTLLERARAMALELAHSAADWPQPSALALVWADPHRSVVELTPDYAAVRKALRESVTLPPHAESLSHALHEAVELLREARQPARRLAVFTDQAGHAWRDVTPGSLAGIDNLAVSVYSVSPERRTNIAITAASGPARLHAETAPVPLEVTLNASGLDATCSVVVRDGQRVIERVGPLAVSADSSRDLSLVLPPRPRGVHALTVEVEPSDRLGFDQQRFVAFQTTERPVAWLVTPPDAGPDADLTALLVQNLLAPEALAPQRQLVALRHVSPAELSELLPEGPDTAPNRRAVELIVITGGVELNEMARQGIRRAAERGAAILLLPGSREDATRWPGLRRLLARSISPPETLGAVTTFSWEAESSFAGRGEALDEMTRTAVRRRVVPSDLEEGAVVDARYADGVPAIISLRRGRGCFVLLTTSPDPLWSELGMRAAGLLTWLHELLGKALGTSDAAATFTVGESARNSFAGLPARGTVHLSCSALEGGGSISVRLANTEPITGWPTEQPGIYSVRTGRQDREAILYAVNWPPEESDLRPIAEEPLAALLGVEELTLEGARDAEPEAATGLLQRLTGLRDAARLLPFVLLGLVIGEALLAARVRRAWPGT